METVLGPLRAECARLGRWDGAVGSGIQDCRTVTVQGQGLSEAAIYSLHIPLMGTSFTGRDVWEAYHSSAQAPHCHYPMTPCLLACPILGCCFLPTCGPSHPPG